MLLVLVLEATDEESELCVDVSVVPVTMGRLVTDPSSRVVDDEPGVGVGVVPVMLGKLLEDPSAGAADEVAAGSEVLEVIVGAVPLKLRRLVADTWSEVVDRSVVEADVEALV